MKYLFLVFGIAALLVGPIILSRNAMRSRTSVIVGAIFVELCLIGFAVSVYDTIYCTEETFGRIETVTKERSSKGGTKYYAGIIYEVDGQSYKEKARFHWVGEFTRQKYHEGDEVALLYNPAHPDRVIVKPLRFLAPAECLLAGGIFSYILIKTLKREQIIL